VQLDQRDDGDAIQAALGEITGGKSVPRVFIGGKFIGGGDDTVSDDNVMTQNRCVIVRLGYSVANQMSRQTALLSCRRVLPSLTVLSTVLICHAVTMRLQLVNLSCAWPSAQWNCSKPTIHWMQTDVELLYVVCPSCMLSSRDALLCYRLCVLFSAGSQGRQW
jgi:hypothetical protein